MLSVHLQPGARAEGISGLHGDSLAVKVHARAQAGRANAALLGLLARQLAVPASALWLASGQSSRTKTVVVPGLSAGEVAARLAASQSSWLSPPPS